MSRAGALLGIAHEARSNVRSISEARRRSRTSAPISEVVPRLVEAVDELDSKAESAERVGRVLVRALREMESRMREAEARIAELEELVGSK